MYYDVCPPKFIPPNVQLRSLRSRQFVVLGLASGHISAKKQSCIACSCKANRSGCEGPRGPLQFRPALNSKLIPAQEGHWAFPSLSLQIWVLVSELDVAALHREVDLADLDSLVPRAQLGWGVPCGGVRLAEFSCCAFAWQKKQSSGLHAVTPAMRCRT